jgi:hypothetical protein
MSGPRALPLALLVAGACLVACGGASTGTVAPPSAEAEPSSAAGAPTAAGVTGTSPTGSPSTTGTPSVTGTEGGARPARARTVTRSASRSPGSYEADPAVKALRLYYLGAAKGVNARTMDIKELERSSTKEWFAHVPELFTFEYGMHYPGPIPFAPMSVTQTSPTRKQVVICVLGDGWLRNPRTGRPTAPRALTRGVATVIRVKASWRISYIVEIGGSCAGASMREESF